MLVPAWSGPAAESDWRHSAGIQVRAHVRHSEDNQFSTRFPPGSALATVDPGTHAEISVLSLRGNLFFRELAQARATVDIYDLYDRNPTSDDNEVDVDELWIRLGREPEPWQLPEDQTAYVKVGKFAKMERQDRRNLESYGLAATAFNRFEDHGVEGGVDLGPHLYAKASLTAGNPVFIRDPNSLAGDNGTGQLIRTGQGNRESGVVTFYDAEVEPFDWYGDALEMGAALGARFANESRSRVVNVMGFYYERDLRSSVDLTGTLYGGDLDVLDAPSLSDQPGDESTVLNGVSGDSKTESGASLWVYYDDATVFAQYVEQEIAGLERRGWEVETSLRFDLPEVWSYRDRPLFSAITPAVRYSALDNAFAGPAEFPAPSVFWDWFKVDVGARLNIYPGVYLTAEYAFNDFVRAGKHEGNNEFLTTLSWSKRL